jgi:hypothetical protein
MGMLKNLKSTVQNANTAAANAATMQAQVAGTSAGPPLPAADLEPIEGITLERYAELMADMGKRGAMDETAREAWCAENGFTWETWLKVQPTWQTRMTGNMPLTTRFGMLLAQAQAR